MIAVFSIDNDINYRNGIGKEQIENIDKILKSLIGDDLTGKDGERYFYHYTDDNHFLEEFKLKYFPITKDDLKEEYERIALRLLAAERNSNGERNKRITKGLLFIRFLNKKLIFLKLEESESINYDTFEITTSYGIDKKYYKAAIFTADRNKVIIIDKNNKVANYWSERFLNLIKTRDDKKNTKDLVGLLNNKNILNSNLSEQDSEYYTKALIKYIKTNKTFDLDVFLKSNSLKSNDSSIDKSTIFNMNYFKDIDESFEIDEEERQRLFKINLKTSESTLIKSVDFYTSINSTEIILDEDNKQLIIKISKDFFGEIKSKFSQYRD